MGFKLAYAKNTHLMNASELTRKRRRFHGKNSLFQLWRSQFLRKEELRRLVEKAQKMRKLKLLSKIRSHGHRKI